MAKKKKAQASKFEDEVVDTYLAACKALLHASRHPEEYVLDDQTAKTVRWVWALMRNARLYALDPADYARIYRAVDIYTTREVAGLPWELTAQTAATQFSGPIGVQSAAILQHEGVDVDQHVDIGIQEAVENCPQQPIEVLEEHGPEHYKSSISNAAEETPPPARLPFETMFVCLGRKLMLTDLQVACRFPGTKDYIPRRTTATVLLGYLLAHTDNPPEGLAAVQGTLSRLSFQAFEIVEYLGPDGQSLGITTIPVYVGRWQRPITLAPWTVNAIVDMFMRYGDYVKERPMTFSHRRKFTKDEDRVALPIPKPYYTVTLKPNHIDEAVKAGQQRIARAFQFSHRFDVSAHDRVRVRRGPLPIDPEQAAKLEKRGYRVYTMTDLSAEDMRLITSPRRKKFIPPKRVDEWMAILSYRIDQYQKGPEDAPYVPALRKGA